MNDKANISHTHDDRYYTETETDNLLNGKANKSHTHSATDITSGTLSTSRLPTISVSKGGTGRTTLTSGYFLRGNGTGSVTLSSIDQVKSALGIGDGLQIKIFESYNSVEQYETDNYTSGSGAGLTIYNITGLNFTPYLVISQSRIRTSYSSDAYTTIHLYKNQFAHILKHSESYTTDVFDKAGSVGYGYIDDTSIWGSNSVKTPFYVSLFSLISFSAIVFGV